MNKEHQIIVNNLAVTYLDEGKGPTLLFVHGWRDKKETFDNLSRQLHLQYRCISVDLPNFGTSQDSEAVVTIEQYADFLCAFASKLELQNYAIIGHSMGGQIAIYATGAGVVQPNTLILIASAGVRSNARMAKQALRFASKLTRRFIPSKLKDKVYKKIGSDYSTQLSQTHKKIISNVLRHDVQEIAKRISVPTLLIYGELDSHTPVIMGQVLQQKIPDSSLTILNGQDHWVHQSAAADIVKIINEFIK